jgi:hypothetical protein
MPVSESDRDGRQRNASGRDTRVAFGMLAFWVPVLGLLAWLLTGPLSHEAEAFFAGLLLVNLVGSVALVGRSRGVAGFDPRTSPLPAIGAGIGIVCTLFVIPHATGESAWAALVGSFAGIGCAMCVVALRWLFWGRRVGPDGKSRPQAG